MKIQALHVGMEVRHPQYGLGTIKTISEAAADILFSDGKHTVAPEAAGLEPAEPQATVTGLSLPLKQFVTETVEAVSAKLGLEKQTKEVEIEVFFHKIVMVRNQLRVLEQKINAHEKLSDAEKVEMQQYITRRYGSMTTFNVLFREKEEQF